LAQLKDFGASSLLINHHKCSCGWNWSKCSSGCFKCGWFNIVSSISAGGSYTKVF